jgi:hypothetical protein
MTIQDPRVLRGQVMGKTSTQTHQSGEFLFELQSCKYKKRSIIKASSKP